MKQLKQLITAIFVLGYYAYLQLKDGFQVTDPIALFQKVLSDPTASQKLKDGWQGADQIDDEVRTAKPWHWAELGEHVAAQLKWFLRQIAPANPQDPPSPGGDAA